MTDLSKPDEDGQAAVDAAAGDLDHQVGNLQRQIGSLTTKVNILAFVMVAACCIGVLVWTAADLRRPTAPEPTDRDQALSELLQARVHCYDSPSEMAAARQRALAAIDRYRWQNRFDAEQHPRPEAEIQMWGPDPIHPEGELSIAKPTSASDTDVSRCFEIMPPPTGSYLPYDK
ncbi:hypothetical protein C1Y40_04971 [Mycobacterium talmoniae]|uniref:Uncharacterized protein n=1 Tax=Mycobacterium talmoniae TaxID=1858794 RepID=A0A2S8BE08_9MYCO|nr:hypothetical protein [Mycobacterium eburneum]PQM44869.1 hypothetical protein C1Y40_04971 [Mycobacterium talmoniae]TDH46672.1 hypothetical protein E2F47_27130 [Mycobacterium eburneum]